MSRRAPYLLLGLIILASILFGQTFARSIFQPAPDPQFAAARSSKALALTDDGTLLVVANPDSNSVSLLDPASQELLAEVAVGVDPRTVTVDHDSKWAYVANHGSDSVSIIDLPGRRVAGEIATNDRPYGIVLSPNDQFLYVAEQGSDTVAIVETGSGQLLQRVAVADRPSGLAINGDGRTLYVTHLLSNRITLLDVSQPYASHLPLLLTSYRPLAASRQPLAPSRQPPATILLWPDSNLVQSFVIGPDGHTAYVPHSRSNTSNPALTFDTTVAPLVSLIDLDTQQHLVGKQIDVGTVDPPGVGLPFDVALNAAGDELWVVNAASNDITVVDLTSRHLVVHLEVGDNPRGIVLAPDGQSAYVNNTLSGSVSVIDTATYTVTATISSSQIPLPPVLLEGKRLFNSSDDPRMSNAQWIACNTCHFDGEQDGRTWIFAFAGPRNTTSLLGMIETYPLRWSGEWDESADSEFAVRQENFGAGLLSGPMHCSLAPVDCVNQPPHQGQSAALDALAAYIDSLANRPSPGHSHGQPLTAAQARGQAIFDRPELGCVTCHPSPLYTDKQAHDVGTVTAGEKIGPNYDTPSLRGLFDSAPYFHDGSAASLFDALTRPSPGNEHDVSQSLTENEIQDLIAYLLALPYE
jgi:YVTN family beta-propeller protein